MTDVKLMERFPGFGWITKEDKEIACVNGSVAWPTLLELIDRNGIRVKANRRSAVDDKRKSDVVTLSSTVTEPIL